MNDRIWTFFYGSFINLDVLRRIGFAPQSYEVAVLHGYDIQIAATANLVPSDQHCVFGIVAGPTQRELGLLYRYTEDRLGTVYLPRAVLVTTRDGKSRPALCYLAPSVKPERPTNEYLDLIIGPAREYGFPPWYVDRLMSFRA